MLPDRVSNPGLLTYESGALPIALRGPAESLGIKSHSCRFGIIRVILFLDYIENGILCILIRIGSMRRFY